MKILQLPFFFLIFISLNVKGQQKEFIFKNFTQEEGLPSNETYYIFEDSRHYLWIATDLGVVRYNGNKFEVFNLPDNVIFKIKEDNGGRIWFFTHKAQLAYFENEKMHLYQYNDILSIYLKKAIITDVYIDSLGNMYLNSANGSNFYLSNKGLVKESKYFTQNTNHEYVIKTIEKNLYFTQRTKVNQWGSDSTFILLDQNKDKILYKIKTNKANSFNHYGCVKMKNDEIVFFGGKNLIKLKRDGSYIISKMPKDILCITPYKDKIWVGMIKGGAVLLNPNFSRAFNDTILPIKSITSIIIDIEGGIWFTTLENGVYNIKKINITHLFGNTQLEVPSFRLLNIEEKALAFANNNGLYLLENNKVSEVIKIANNNISNITNYNKKSVLMSGDIFINDFFITKINNPYIKNILLLNSPSEVISLGKDSLLKNNIQHISIAKKNGKSFDFVSKRELKSNLTQIFVDKSMKIWAGCIDGLYNSNNQLDRFTPFQPSSPLLQKGISCIRQMDNGILVTGVRFGGIILIKDTNIVANITELEGLLSNKVKYLLPLKNDLWVATAKGISVIRFLSYNPLRYKIFNVGKNDGFYNMTINQLIEFEQKIVAATSNGIYFIENPEEILSRSPPAIPFYINNINYYKGDTSRISTITLPYSNNSLRIKYSAICFNSPEEIKYIYRIQKKDSNWKQTTNTELLFENLEPGSYNIQIRAVIPSQNRSSALLNFKITVDKPWWQNNWFRLLLLLLVTGVIYLYVANRIRLIRNKEKRKTELNTKIAELEQTALRSQMNPHFIFNCLTSIQQLIVTGNKTDANEYLVKFARLIRKTLELSAIPFISIREEIEYLGEYILLEQLRLSGEFNYTISTDNNIDIDRTRIPNMMIQPVVENCIRHGIKPMENKKGHIDIRFENKGENIVCTITDNGVGRNHYISTDSDNFTKHKSYGIDIIEKRLKTFAEFNRNDFGIQINDLENDDGSPCGTQVIIQLPFKTNL